MKPFLPLRETALKQYRSSFPLLSFKERTMSDPKAADRTDPNKKSADQIRQDTELGVDELNAVSGGSGTLTNISNMKHESLKAIAQNLRG